MDKSSEQPTATSAPAAQQPTTFVSDTTVTSEPTTSAADTPLPSTKEAKLATPDPAPAANSSTKPNGAGGTAHAAKGNGATPNDPPSSIHKPDVPFSLDRFRSKGGDDGAARVETLVTALPHCRLSDAKDFIRLHPDKAYWSPELCFVNVPVKGARRESLHLIDEELATQYLPTGKVKRFRLVLASKPDDSFFLAEVPTHNLDNAWNSSALDGAERARTRWVEVTSQKEAGIESYKVTPAREKDAFDEPKWPKQSLLALIEKTFAGRIIDTKDHPALLRLIGAKQKL
jgi:hypothetical protein